MAQQADTRALGITHQGGKFHYALVQGQTDGSFSVLHQGLVARLEDLRNPLEARGTPIASAAAIGIACARLGDALAPIAPGIPVLVIDTLQAHLLAALANPACLASPLVALVVTDKLTTLVRVDAPGHYAALGRSLDSAAGNVFDALAEQLGMDLPGGAALARLADFGDADGDRMPEPGVDAASLDFSFAHLRMAALRRAQELEGSPCEQPRADLVASVQQAVVGQLARQALKALQRTGSTQLALCGKAANNTTLRAALQGHCHLVTPVPGASRAIRLAQAAYLLQARQTQAATQPTHQP